MATRRKKSTSKKQNGADAKATPKTEEISLDAATSATAHEIGARVEVSTDDGETLVSAERRIALAQAGLGTLQETYEQQKLEALKHVARARNEYHTLVMAVAKKHDIDLGPESQQEWRFEPRSNAYERTA